MKFLFQYQYDPDPSLFRDIGVGVWEKDIVIMRLHSSNISNVQIADPEADQVVGFVAVDLCPLAAGFPAVTGWYNITDWLGKCRGQLKLSVTPLSTEGLDKQIHSEEDLNESQVQTLIMINGSYYCFDILSMQNLYFLSKPAILLHTELTKIPHFLILKQL